jgi:ArsR family transcriptional regulator, arsenate/arsenite/antimonite-responsive transcriptional repressor
LICKIIPLNPHHFPDNHRNIAIKLPMGATKTEEYSIKTLRMAALFQSLAHPARVAILEQLAKADSCQCGELVNELPLAQSTVSQHLKAMSQAGMIKGSIEGAATCYCIDRKAMRQLADFVDKINRVLEHQDQQCC